jgi:hypothetical protein
MATAEEASASTGRNTTKAFDVYREHTDGMLELVASAVESSGRGVDRERAAIEKASVVQDGAGSATFRVCPAGSMSGPHKLARRLSTGVWE